MRVATYAYESELSVFLPLGSIWMRDDNDKESSNTRDRYCENQIYKLKFMYISKLI